ncbi:MAG: HNH endonuclease [Solirubrobacterales bacterium]
MSEPRTPPSNDALSTTADATSATVDAPAVADPCADCPSTAGAPAASTPSAAEPQVRRCCGSCRHAIWDASDMLNTFGLGWPVRPRCSNHPDSPGRMRKVPGLGPCRNWEPKPAPPVRIEPDEPVGPTECKITLTKGLVATVDPEDYEWLSGFRWHATTSRGKTYAATTVHGKSISMHRMIMNPPKGMQVDHKSTDRLNNHRDNLRLATPGQNRHNSRSCARKGRPKSSRFMGVTRCGDRWKVKITHEGVAHFLGYFDDEVEAALAWDAKAKELRGEFAYLNFPDGPPPGHAKREP